MHAAAFRSLRSAPHRQRGPRPDLWAFAALLVLTNVALLSGSVTTSLVFFPARVGDGEWWRVLTHPFVHVSGYHLLLDGAAFLLLYGGLDEKRSARRLLYVVGAGIGSVGFSLLTSPEVHAAGLCGLSGIDHGLMAVYGLELARSRTQGSTSRSIGLACFFAVFAKAGVESVAGRALFSSLHFGLMGVPVAACHLGGVLGGTAAFLAGSHRWAARRNPLLEGGHHG